MAAIQIIKDIFYHPYFNFLLVTIACACFYYLINGTKNYKKSIWVAYSLIFIYALLIFIKNVTYQIHHPAIWDFTAFYLYGKVAASGYNFYLPENFNVVFNSLNLPFSDFNGLIEEVVNVGFLYPPSTILYFYPLGFLSFENALIAWTIFNLFFVFGCLYLLYELFFNEYKLNGLFLIATLVFIFTPSLITINCSQTNFIVLFLLLLMKKYSQKKVSGIFLALAFCTKPYMIIFGVFFLLRKKWGNIIYFIGSILVILIVTLILFGKEPFISYIFNNPSHRLPESNFYEAVNQSLNAILIRNNLISMNTPLIYIYTIIGILIFTFVQIFYLLKKSLYDYIWAILLLIGLLIYPGTLSHYGTLLLFIIFQFFDETKQLGFKPYLSVLVVAFFYYLSTVSVFASICFLLFTIIIKSLIALNQIGRLSDETKQMQYH